MNARFIEALRCEKNHNVPFIPAIYEHKAWFVQKSPSVVCQDVDLFVDAVLSEYEQVRADALVVGIDVYNVEAEALGCKVVYFGETEMYIPAISPDGGILEEPYVVGDLKLPDPNCDGRMPLNLEVAKRVHQKLGNHVPIRGALSGPFSLAANLVGAEILFMMTITHPQEVHELLRFAANIAKVYGQEFLKRGCDVILFDSQASPDLLSPSMFEEFVLPPTQNIVAHFNDLGQQHVPLIIGGNTTKIIESYVATGANNILCDATADAPTFLEVCRSAKRAFRRNIGTTNFAILQPEVFSERAKQCLKESEGYPGFILGTGVVPYGTPLENLHAIRSAVDEYNRMKDNH